MPFMRRISEELVSMEVFYLSDWSYFAVPISEELVSMEADRRRSSLP